MAKVTIRQKPLSNGQVSLWLDYWVNGVRKNKTLNIHVWPKHEKSRNPLERNHYDEAYTKAKIIKNKLEAELINQEHDITNKIDKRASFFGFFDELAKTRNHNWQNARKQLVAFSKGNLPFGNVNEGFLEGFQDFLKDRLKDSTVRSYMGIVATTLNKALKRKLINTNPIKNIDRIREKEVPVKYLTKGHLETLEKNSQNIPQWFKDAFYFGCYTGLRLSDLETLTYNDITGSDGSNGKSTLLIRKVQAKTGEEVIIPISDKAYEILERQHTAKTIFALKSRTTTKRYIARWRKQSGIHFTFHSSRHTFGTMLQSAGSDINVTSKLMGHKSLSMTLRYAKVVDRAKEDSIGKLNSFLS